MLAAGSYGARPIKRQWGFTSKGGEQVAVTFEIVDASDAGHRITWFGYFTEGTWERTVESLRLCGFDPADTSDWEGTNDVTVEIVVEHEAWEGKKQAKVRWINDLAGGKGVTLKEQMNDAQRRQFAARLKTMAARPKQPKGDTSFPPRDEPESY